MFKLFVAFVSYKKNYTNHLGLLTIALCCFYGLSFGQTSYNNLWVPATLGALPPVVSLTDGSWLKGNLGPQTAYPQVPQSNALSGNMLAISNPLYLILIRTFRVRI